MALSYPDYHRVRCQRSCTWPLSFIDVGFPSREALPLLRLRTLRGTTSTPPIPSSPKSSEFIGASLLVDPSEKVVKVPSSDVTGLLMAQPKMLPELKPVIEGGHFFTQGGHAKAQADGDERKSGEVFSSSRVFLRHVHTRMKSDYKKR